MKGGIYRAAAARLPSTLQSTMFPGRDAGAAHPSRRTVRLRNAHTLGHPETSSTPTRCEEGVPAVTHVYGSSSRSEPPELMSA